MVIVKAKEYPTRHRFPPLILVHSYQGGRQVSAGTVSAWGSWSQRHPSAWRGKRPFHRNASAKSSMLLYRSEEHTSELQSIMRISYDVFCLKKKKKSNNKHS